VKIDLTEDDEISGDGMDNEFGEEINDEWGPETT
jgi:hypothetical protein